MKLSTIKQIENIAHEVGGVVSLAQGIPSINSDDLIRDYVIEAIQANKVDHYSLSAGLPELRDLVKEKLVLDKNTEVIATAGAIEALSTIFLSLCSDGDEVITFSPYYAPYLGIVELSGGKLVTETLKSEDGWRPSIKSLESKINSKTKIIFLCTPHNPTGVVFSEVELKAIGDLAIKHNLLIVSDDVYKNFFYNNQKPFALYDIEGLRDRLLTVVSFSKDFSLSGWRIGFLTGPKELLEKMFGVHDMLVNCAPVVSQYAGMSALLHDEEILNKNMPEYKKKRDLMGKYLKELNDYLDFTYPEGSYYFFPKIKELENSEEFCFDMVRMTKVAVVPGGSFGMGGEGHVRLCFGRSKEDIAEGMQRFGNYLKDWSKKKNS